MRESVPAGAVPAFEKGCCSAKCVPRLRCCSVSSGARLAWKRKRSLETNCERIREIGEARVSISRWKSRHYASICVENRDSTAADLRQPRSTGLSKRYLICISRYWCTLLWSPMLSAERHGAKNGTPEDRGASYFAKCRKKNSQIWNSIQHSSFLTSRCVCVNSIGNASGKFRCRSIFAHSRSADEFHHAAIRVQLLAAGRRCSRSDRKPAAMYLKYWRHVHDVPRGLATRAGMR
jgi:hypothetical protein